MKLDRDMWLKEIAMHDDLFFSFTTACPKNDVHAELLVSNLWRSPELVLAVLTIRNGADNHSRKQ